MRACFILHEKTHQELEKRYNTLTNNMPDLHITGTSFQVSERGFSMVIFYKTEHDKK